MKKEISNPYLDGRCFFCGMNNKNGLKLKFFVDEETGVVSTEYLPSSQFTGQGNVLHGGIMMGIIDEIMGWTTYVVTGSKAVTSDVQVKFIRPVYLGAMLRVKCKAYRKEGPRVHLQVEALNPEGRQCVNATGTYHILPEDRFERLITGG